MRFWYTTLCKTTKIKACRNIIIFINKCTAKWFISSWPVLANLINLIHCLILHANHIHCTSQFNSLQMWYTKINILCTKLSNYMYLKCRNEPLTNGTVFPRTYNNNNFYFCYSYYSSCGQDWVLRKHYFSNGFFIW